MSDLSKQIVDKILYHGKHKGHSYETEKKEYNERAMSVKKGYDERAVVAKAKLQNKTTETMKKY